MQNLSMERAGVRVRPLQPSLADTHHIMAALEVLLRGIDCFQQGAGTKARPPTILPV